MGDCLEEEDVERCESHLIIQIHTMFSLLIQLMDV